MDNNEQRRSRRFDSLNLLHYQVVDARQGQLGDGMARTLNVSKGGLLLETNTAFERGQELTVTVGLEEEQVDVRGQVVHCQPSGERLYATGVRFENLAPEAAKVLERYLKLFQAADQQ